MSLSYLHLKVVAVRQFAEHVTAENPVHHDNVSVAPGKILTSWCTSVSRTKSKLHGIIVKGWYAETPEQAMKSRFREVVRLVT